MARTIQCAKLGKEAEGLDFPPLPGELGKRIYETISKEAWQGWLKQQTMLINENRLNMADPRARQYLLKQTEKYFFGEAPIPRKATCRRLRADRPSCFPAMKSRPSQAGFIFLRSLFERARAPSSTPPFAHLPASC